SRAKPWCRLCAHGVGGSTGRVYGSCTTHSQLSGNQVEIMLKKERAAWIAKTLAELYPDPPIPLAHKDPYTLLVAVLLSAQCTDERVNKVTPALWQLADNAQDMAQQSVADIEKIIKPCGLSPQKAKAIRGLSEIIVNEHQSQVPDNFTD